MLENIINKFLSVRKNNKYKTLKNTGRITINNTKKRKYIFKNKHHKSRLTLKNGVIQHSGGDKSGKAAIATKAKSFGERAKAFGASAKKKIINKTIKSKRSKDKSEMDHTKLKNYLTKKKKLRDKMSWKVGKALGVKLPKLLLKPGTIPLKYAQNKIMNTYRYVKGYTGALNNYTNKMQNVKDYISTLKTTFNTSINNITNKYTPTQTQTSTQQSNKSLEEKTKSAIAILNKQRQTTTNKAEFESINSNIKELEAINREYKKQKKLFEKIERKRNKMIENKDTTLTKDIGRFWNNIKQSTKDGGMSVGRMFKNQGLKLFGMRNKMASNFENAANRIQKQIDSIDNKLEDNPDLSSREKRRLLKKKSRLNAKRVKYLEQANTNRIISEELRRNKYNIFGYLSRSNERSELINSRSLLATNITNENNKVQSLLETCPYISERLRKIGIPTDINNMGPQQKTQLVELYGKISAGDITKQNAVQEHKDFFNGIIQAKFNNNIIPRTLKPVNTDSFEISRVNLNDLQKRINKWVPTRTLPKSANKKDNNKKSQHNAQTRNTNPTQHTNNHYRTTRNFSILTTQNPENQDNTPDNANS